MCDIDPKIAHGYKKSMQPTLTELEILGIVPFGPVTKDRAHYALRLSFPGWNGWKPGQFIMLRPPEFGLELIWGRPFSICHLTPRHLICFFRVEGRGTRIISKLQPGNKVLVWGPLGTAFEVCLDTPTLLLAGGMGMAPFVGYVASHPQPWNLSMVFGHRDALACYPIDNISDDIQVDSLRENEPGDLENFIYTMQERISDCASQNGVALACGPLPFLRTVKHLAAQSGCRLQVSVERRMACGVGACLGCVCKTTPRWKFGAALPVQTCLHGPVFWADEIEL